MIQSELFGKLSDKRTKFIIDMIRNAMLPYEAEKTYYEMQKIGVFENKFEEEAFDEFFKIAPKPKLLLDFACGDGRHSAKLAERAECVVALDLSARNLAKAHRRLQNLYNVALIRACMFNPPFKSGCFGSIWFSQAFEYVPPDVREKFLLTLRGLLMPSGLLYMSVETWQDQSLWKSLKNLLGDFKLFAYWKFVKRQPLRWGEFLYYLPPMEAEFRDWHYHVHTSKRTIETLLRKLGMTIIEEGLHDYIYLLCRSPAKSYA